MNILNHFELPYLENKITAIGSNTGGGKSSVLEYIILEHMQKGFNCLYVGEVDSRYFFNRIKRKKEQIPYKTKSNNGNLFYLYNDNIELIEELVKRNKIQSIFFDDYVGYPKKTKNKKILLTEKTIKKLAITIKNKREEIMDSMTLIKHISDICDVSCYVSINLTKRLNSGLGILPMSESTIDSTVILSDVYMSVTKNYESNNEFNGKINLIKNRIGRETNNYLKIKL